MSIFISVEEYTLNRMMYHGRNWDYEVHDNDLPWYINGHMATTWIIGNNMDKDEASYLRAHMPEVVTLINGGNEGCQVAADYLMEKGWAYHWAWRIVQVLTPFPF